MSLGILPGAVPPAAKPSTSRGRLEHAISWNAAAAHARRGYHTFPMRLPNGGFTTPRSRYRSMRRRTSIPCSDFTRIPVDARRSCRRLFPHGQGGLAGRAGDAHPHAAARTRRLHRPGTADHPQCAKALPGVHAPRHQHGRTRRPRGIRSARISKRREAHRCRACRRAANQGRAITAATRMSGIHEAAILALVRDRGMVTLEFVCRKLAGVRVEEAPAELLGEIDATLLKAGW